MKKISSYESIVRYKVKLKELEVVVKLVIADALKRKGA